MRLYFGDGLPSAFEDHRPLIHHPLNAVSQLLLEVDLIQQLGNQFLPRARGVLVGVGPGANLEGSRVVKKNCPGYGGGQGVDLFGNSEP